MKWRVAASRKILRVGIASVLSSTLALAAQCARAGVVDWAQWSSNTSAAFAGLSLTYAGELSGLFTSYPSWTPPATWADGTIVSNAPPSTGGMVKLLGGGLTGAVLDTITFSAPVVNPVMAIWSLGAGPTQAEFAFTNATPTIVAGGISTEYGGSSIVLDGNAVFGNEGNGTVEFLGTFTSISWTNPLLENYYGFTVGVPAAVPEPSAIALGAAGFALLLVIARRSRR